MATNRPTITFSPQAFELVRRHMDENGVLMLPVRVFLECIRGVWVADVKGRERAEDVTLPKGCDVDAIEGVLREHVLEKVGDSRRGGWRMPPLSTAYVCDDGKVRTIGQMLEGISVELMPHDEADFDMLMDCFGVDGTRPLELTPCPREQPR